MNLIFLSIKFIFFWFDYKRINYIQISCRGKLNNIIKCFLSTYIGFPRNQFYNWNYFYNIFFLLFCFVVFISFSHFSLLIHLLFKEIEKRLPSIYVTKPTLIFATTLANMNIVDLYLVKKYFSIPVSYTHLTLPTKA